MGAVKGFRPVIRWLRQGTKGAADDDGRVGRRRRGAGVETEDSGIPRRGLTRPVGKQSALASSDQDSELSASVGMGGINHEGVARDGSPA